MSPSIIPSVNFTGSATASDFVFDIDRPPHTHPYAVQAYLYSVGAETPSMDRQGWEEGMAKGVQRLRVAQESDYGQVTRRELYDVADPSLFLRDPPCDQAMEEYPNFPSLGINACPDRQTRL